MSKENLKLKKRLDAAQKRKKELEKKRKEKEEDEHEKRKNVIRKETWELIKRNTGPVMNCPDCQKQLHRGGGLVTHSIKYCKSLKI